MHKVKLVTRDGGHVHDAVIPPFTPPAEMIMWGSRFFALDDTSQVEPDGTWVRVYREGLCFAIVDAQAQQPGN